MGDQRIIQEASMNLVVDDRWRVCASHSLDVPLSPGAVWGQMRDLRHFITIDPLHARVRFTDGAPGSVPRRGTRLLIEHRLAGVGPDRVGRVLWWEEGRGYAVSDLSKRGVRVGFPHICRYEVAQRPDGGARLSITARGRWTATWLPRPIVKLWLAWVMFNTGWRLSAHFSALEKQQRD
jgi:hypothetical protein